MTREIYRNEQIRKLIKFINNYSSNTIIGTVNAVWAQIQ